MSAFIKSKDLKLHKSDLLTCLGNLYYKFGEITLLENLVEKYIVFYPPISFNLLEYLKRTKKFKELHKLCEKVLPLLRTGKDLFSFKPDHYYDNEDLEIKVRRLLVDTFDKKCEYKLIINNLEKLFEISKEINDYKLLKAEYKSLVEKNLFLEKIKKLFSKNTDIKELFEVFKVENDNEKILKLAQVHFEEGCIHQMVEFVKDKYPKECFGIYQRKINKLLEVADTGIYETICKDLLKMRKIGLDKEFNLYLNDIKNNFYRRRSLLAEMDKHKL